MLNHETHTATQCSAHACTTPETSCARRKEAALSRQLEINAIRRSLQAAYPPN